MVRVYRGDDSIAGIKLLSIVGNNAGRAPSLGGDTDNVHFSEHGAAVILNTGDQRTGQCATAADRNTKAVVLEKAEKHEQSNASAFLIRRHEVLAGYARKVRLDPFILKVLAQQLMRAHLHSAPQLATFT